jgi:hypothetical protein
MERTPSVASYSSVKFMLMLSALTLILATFARLNASREAAASNVGNHPGDIGSASDILAAAHARGHELASFAAG